MPDSTLQALQTKRSDYDQEVVWVKFLLDAYGGTGGFAGRIEPPAIASLGWVADAYGIGIGTGFGDGIPSDVKVRSTSYLDQYPREENDKYQRRVDISHYQNFVATILDLLLSYALKSPSTTEDLPEKLAAWKENATISGDSWIDLMNHTLARRTALMGWVPLFIDQVAREAGLSVAQVEQSDERLDPYVIALTPSNVLDWYIDPKTCKMVWAKLSFVEMRQIDPLKPAQKWTVYKVLTTTEITTWEVDESQEEPSAVQMGEPAKHGFGAVPLVSFQQRPHIEEKLRGVSMIGDPAIASRRLFNLDSELDEHIRSNVFALLQVPYPGGGEPPKELIGGNGNAVGLSDQSQRDYKFVSPESSVAATLETRITNTIREIYRRARTQFGDNGSSQQSGLAKQWDFEETNRLLSDFVAQLARSEKQTYVVVGTGMGIPSKELDKIRVLPSTNFAVEDLMAELESAAQALLLGLGPTADMQIRRRMAQKVVPNVTPDTVAEIEGELEAQRNAELSSAGEAREIDDAASGTDDDEVDEPGDGGEPPEDGDE